MGAPTSGTGRPRHHRGGPGQPAPGGGTFAAYGSVPFVFDAPHMNDAGSMVFVGWTDGGPGHASTATPRRTGLEAMALEGQAPYAAAGFRNAVINNHDVVAFQAFDGSVGNLRGVYPMRHPAVAG